MRPASHRMTLRDCPKFTYKVQSALACTVLLIALSCGVPAHLPALVDADPAVLPKCQSISLSPFTLVPFPLRAISRLFAANRRRRRTASRGREKTTDCRRWCSTKNVRNAPPSEWVSPEILLASLFFIRCACLTLSLSLSLARSGAPVGCFDAFAGVVLSRY